MSEFLQDNTVPSVPINKGGLCVCCIQLIGREGLNAREGDTLNCDMCLTRVVFHAGIWEWDITAEYPAPADLTPALPLPVPPPGVLVEDPPEGLGEVPGAESAAMPRGPNRTMISGVVPFKRPEANVPDQQE